MWPARHPWCREPLAARTADVPRNQVSPDRSLWGVADGRCGAAEGWGMAARDTDCMKYDLPSPGAGLTRGVPISLCSSSSSWLAGLASAAKPRHRRNAYRDGPALRSLSCGHTSRSGGDAQRAADAFSTLKWLLAESCRSRKAMRIAVRAGAVGYVDPDAARLTLMLSAGRQGGQTHGACLSSPVPSGQSI